jgi:hypothetical protein
MVRMPPDAFSEGVPARALAIGVFSDAAIWLFITAAPPVPELCSN